MSRRHEVLRALTEANGPIAGGQLAERFHVSRQVIVHDVALLRAEGQAIDATAFGYRIAARPGGVRDVFATRHRSQEAEVELNCLVDLGITVLDVVVYHPVYGELRGGLDLHSRRDVAFFLERLQRERGQLLSSLTDGRHVHTVEARDRETLSAGRRALDALGLLDEAEGTR